MKKFFFLSLWAVMCACGNRTEQGHDNDTHQNETAPRGNQEHDAHVLRIAPEMMRDLRTTTAIVSARAAGDTVTALGELRVNEDAYAEIGSPIEARVSRLMAAPGDLVSAGQALVTLDSPDVGRARAAILTTRARLELAEQSATRRRGLAEDNIVPAREVETAEAELSQARAEQRAASQALVALGAARGNGAQFTLSTPIAGTIIERNALLGRMVDAEHPLFIVGDLSHLWLIVHAFERDAVRIRTGRVARVSFPALPGQSFEGNVTRIGSRVDPTSRTVDVRVELDNRDGVLRPGMSANARIPVGDDTTPVVAVPITALQRVQEGWCVFLPREENGVFELRIVGRGRDLGGDVEIVQGLRVGERIVVDGAFLLRAEAEKLRGAGDEHEH